MDVGDYFSCELLQDVGSSSEIFMGCKVEEVAESEFFTFTSPLTAGVFGAPQMILHYHDQFPPFSSVLHCSLGLSELHCLQACPLPDVVFPPLPLSALSSSPFHCALQDGFGQT